MLVENLWSGRDSHLGRRLASEGIDVLEDYGSFALAFVNEDQRKNLKRNFDVTAMPDRTMTGRGAFSFDTRKGEPVLPGDLRADPGQDPNYRTHIVQFVGPIKQEWIQALKSTG